MTENKENRTRDKFVPLLGCLLQTVVACGRGLDSVCYTSLFKEYLSLIYVLHAKFRISFVCR